MLKIKKYIQDLLTNPITPFDIDDPKLIKLFSFFLHTAPRISSNRAVSIDDIRLMVNWNTFITDFENSSYQFVATTYPKSIASLYENYHLASSSELKRRARGFVCRKKDKDELDVVCLLRHIRNAIAHCNVYYLNSGNRKFILFEDCNDKSKPTARILFSQTDLKKLKDTILR